ncbi:MAG: DUF1997 domain-containing protein [Elainella sp. C42_A2020_010]|nr:DUF1997 domain-containing protein [Elainella sp. C42_A2020_010]RNJ67307.1 MAG: DUF1997 domain-containing protein [Leptolyngbya sp. IPPAS B-1204]
MNVRFSAVQSVEIAVPEQPIPIQHYLRQPQRLIHALIDPTQVELLGNDCFRFKMRPLHFMTLSLQPTVDLRIWAESDGTIYLRSIGCEIRGIEYINRRFHLGLMGQLSPVQQAAKTYLKGRADLQVEVDLPPPLSLTPRPLVETTGNGLLRSVLLTIKQRLVHQLLSDYCLWVAAQSEASPQTLGIGLDQSALLSPNGSVL